MANDLAADDSAVGVKAAGFNLDLVNSLEVVPGTMAASTDKIRTCNSGRQVIQFLDYFYLNIL